jgi:hypothetical protein
MRLLPYLQGRVPLSRNWVTDSFMDGILRGDNRDPGASTKEYVQWQRGPLTKTAWNEMTRWIDTSIDHGVWLVLVLHGIEGIGWEPLSTETLRNYFDYIKQRENRLRIVTFRDAAKYARERMSSTVSSKRVGNGIEVSVRHSLDPKLYDLRLTARTVIPNDWTVVRFRQGNDERWIPIHRERNEPYVLYRIAPDGTTATLEPGAN